MATEPISLRVPEEAKAEVVQVPTSQSLVQYATNLTTSPWLTLATNTPGAYGVGTVQGPAATGLQRFYRLSGP